MCIRDRHNDQDEWLGVRHLGRYGLVGLLNTSIDFALTNAMVIATGASNAAALFVISLTACFVATLNSYRLNKSWTFGLRGQQLPHTTLLKYFSVAFLAMMVNTSVFLFAYQFLTEQMQMGRLASINLAKVFAVGTAAIVAFLGFRISVFRPAVVEMFRRSFRFDVLTQTTSLTKQLTVIVVGAAVVRVFYLMLTTAVSGEATNYGWVAQSIAQGDWTAARSGWLNLFCYWEALFRIIGLGPIPGAIAASLIPGVLLVCPITWSARCLYGERVAWLAGWLTAFHPRLIAYSGNGFPDTFALLLLSAAVSVLVAASIKGMSYRQMLIAGLFLGAYFCVNNEGIVVTAILLLGFVLLGRRANVPVSLLRCSGCLVVGFMLFAAAYSSLTFAKTGDSGLFHKLSIFETKYSVQLSPQSAARETYGIDRQDGSSSWGPLTPLEHLRNWGARFPGNLLHTLRTTPGVLLTPMWFFALLLPLFSGSKDGTLLPEWPWLVMLFFPFVIYPVIYVEARFLFPAILPVHLFGAAGLVVLAVFIGNQGYAAYFYPLAVGGVLAACAIMAMWRGHQLEQGYQYNRQLASWIQQHVPTGETIVGDGYGFVSTTGFLAQYPTANRLIHYDPQKVVDFVKAKHAEWLILYEPFIVRVNPELLPYLSRGMPEMTLQYQVTDNMNRRIQVYRLNSTQEFPQKNKEPQNGATVGIPERKNPGRGGAALGISGNY